MERLGGVGGAGLGDEGEGALGGGADVVESRGGNLAAVFWPSLDQGSIQKRPLEASPTWAWLRRMEWAMHEGDLSLVEGSGERRRERPGRRFAGRAGMERFAGLPGGGGAEEDAVPVVVDEGLAVVIPDGVEDAGGVLALAFGDELLDVDEGVVVVWDRRRSSR